MGDLTSSVKVCPRCKEEILFTQEARNALSRRDNKTSICSKCGMDEGMIDAEMQKLNQKEIDFRISLNPKFGSIEWQQMMVYRCLFEFQQGKELNRELKAFISVQCGHLNMSEKDYTEMLQKAVN
jgi:predicted RNA-binding Zn-ribbon protein involved in translation (DUF1610 family)